MVFEISTSAFEQGGRTPRVHTADGQNVSPPIQWRDVPAGTSALALICEDPDAPKGTFTHWILFDVPPRGGGLPQGVTARSLPAGAKLGTNSFGDVGYDGPDPPPGHPHRYVFKLFALDAPLGLPEGVDRDRFLAAIRGHVLGEARLTGTYSR